MDLFYINITLGSLLVLLILVLVLKRVKLNVRGKVKKLKEEGMNIKQILSIANKKGWDEREVKLYFLLYLFADFQEKGRKLYQIKNMALRRGWPPEMVDRVYTKLKEHQDQ